MEYNHHLMAIGWDLVCKSWCLVRVGPSECLIQASVYGHWLQTSGPVLHDLVQRTMMSCKRHMSRRRHTFPMAFPREVDEEFTGTIIRGTASLYEQILSFTTKPVQQDLSA